MTKHLSEQLDQRLAEAGYVRIGLDPSPGQDQFSEAGIPGFIFARHRRLDDPSREAVVSQDKDALLVTFRTVAVPSSIPQSFSERIGTTLAAVFTPKAELPKPLTLFAFEAVNRYAPPLRMPAGEADPASKPSRYLTMAKVLRDMMLSGEAAFFIDPAASTREWTMLSAHVQPADRPGDDLSEGARFVRLREVTVAVATPVNPSPFALYIRAKDFVRLPGRGPTPVERSSIHTFNSANREINHSKLIRSHVEGHAVLECPVLPNSLKM